MKILISKPSNRSFQVNERTSVVNVNKLNSNIKISNVGLQGGTVLPSGGDTNMVLTKSSKRDYDFEWTKTLDSIELEKVQVNGGYF